ncbi:FecR family protein [Saccharicrinis fermentans]|uniref:Fec operon regulator FecR n=1 Tax=Saccharicrinis fermentans DSM 9555 = JCM 21142 TaxID=869213 RepID=W7Y5W9_9BACT|nr:FecR family protein [Saccharicrinis fermentans]GAF03537.1 fec operon regulator FecR [Saccharicrinis fermentans DSM 9555 = JCM 21142]
MIEDKVNNSYRISYLISQFLNGNIEDDELKELQRWENLSSNNKKLVEELKDSECLEDRDHRIDRINLESEWLRFSNKVKYKRITLQKRVIRMAQYAAILLLPLSIVYLVFHMGTVKKSPASCAPCEITPGKHCAQLVLSNGKVLQLGSCKGSIKEQDGTIITTDSAIVFYKRNEDEKVEGLIYNEIRVVQGQEYHMRLADGTQVWINSMSSIKFPVHFSEGKREVEITGEVYFEVMPNKEKPFIVHTPIHDVRVLGTSFNISCYENDASVTTTLVEGKVLIENIPGELSPAQLTPNLQYNYHKSLHKASIEEVDAIAYAAWTKGYFQFENETLEQIFKKLERWYKIDVLYKSTSSRKEVFNGRLPRFENASTIMEMIEEVSNVKISLKDNLVVIE